MHLATAFVYALSVFIYCLDADMQSLISDRAKKKQQERYDRMVSYAQTTSAQNKQGRIIGDITPAPGSVVSGAGHYIPAYMCDDSGSIQSNVFEGDNGSEVSDARGVFDSNDLRSKGSNAEVHWLKKKT